MSETKHRRFHSAEEIVKRIDRLKDRAIDCLQRAEILEAEASAYELPPERLAAMALEKREQAGKLRKTANNTIHNLIPGLSQKLAQIKTPLLPGIDGDESIPQRLSVT